MTVYLIIDESGEKGYSNNKKHSKNISEDENKFGTMVGYFIVEEQLEIIREILKEKFKPFSKYSKNGKLHITDLPKEEQPLLRETVLGILRESEARWIHMSINKKGFENYSGEEKLSLHSELFNGIFVKAISYIYDNTRSKTINLKVISDTLVKKTIKDFEKSVLFIKNLMSGQREHIKHKKGYTMKSTVEFSDNSFLLDELTIDITCEDTELTLVADVLSNTTYYFLNQELKSNPNTNLDAFQSLKNHPLQSLVYGCFDHTKEESMNYFGTIYRKDY